MILVIKSVLLWNILSFILLPINLDGMFECGPRYFSQNNLKIYHVFIIPSETLNIEKRLCSISTWETRRVLKGGFEFQLLFSFPVKLVFTFCMKFSTHISISKTFTWNFFRERQSVFVWTDKTRGFSEKKKQSKAALWIKLVEISWSSVIL